MRKLMWAFAAAVALVPVAPASAAPVQFTQTFTGGFDVSVNGGPLTASGPITITGIVDSAALDLNPSLFYGEFALTSATITGAGFTNQPITTPLSLVTFTFGGSDTYFAFQRLGEFNEGITGWNGATSAGPFMTDVNSLATLTALPYTTVGTSTFWYDGLGSNVWTLGNGSTIGANIGGSGPDGTFTISLLAAVPEPATLAVFGLMAAGGLGYVRRRVKATVAG